MNTSATWYRNGVQQSGGYAGCVGYDGGPVVGRFAFTTPQAGASGFSFRSSGLSPAGSSSWSSGVGPGNFRFAVTSGGSANTNKVGTDGAAVGVNWDSPPTLDSDGTKSVQLLPNSSYYLWIWPADSSYNLWRITGVEITLGGAYGSPAVPGAADGYFGAAVGITLSGASSGASFTVTASCAGRTETLQTRGTSSYLSWTPPIEVYGPLLPNAASAAATITVETFYAGQSRGTRQTTITLRFRQEDVGPCLAAGWYSHAPYNESVSGIRKYIQGISRARISFDGSKVSPRCGATAAAYSVTAAGETDGAEPYETPVLNGTTAVTVRVTDSRGFSAEESFDITPLTYAPPTLSQVGIFRCDQSGAPDGDGIYCSVTATAIFSALDGENTARILRYQKTAGGSYGGGTAQASGATVIVGPIDADTVYDFMLEIRDSAGGVGSVTRRIPGRNWAMKFRPGGEGVGFGMAPQADRRLQLPAGWTLMIGNTALSESELQALKALLS